MDQRGVYESARRAATGAARTNTGGKVRYSAITVSVLCCVASFTQTGAAQEQEILTIDQPRRRMPFPHFWERKCSAPGRAILSLRDDYRRDLRAVKGDYTGFSTSASMPFFTTRLGLYNEDKSGDALLELQLRGSDLRRVAGERCAAVHRVELHAQSACQRAACRLLLVRAESFAAEGLLQNGAR